MRRRGERQRWRTARRSCENTQQQTSRALPPLFDADPRRSMLPLSSPLCRTRRRRRRRCRRDAPLARSAAERLSSAERDELAAAAAAGLAAQDLAALRQDKRMLRASLTNAKASRLLKQVRDDVAR